MAVLTAAERKSSEFSSFKARRWRCGEAPNGFRIRTRLGQGVCGSHHVQEYSNYSCISSPRQLSAFFTSFCTFVRRAIADFFHLGSAGSSSSAPQDANAVVQNFLNSLKGGNLSGGAQQRQADKPYTTLPDLLTSSTTTAFISTASPQQIDSLCTLLPPELFLLAQGSAESTSAAETSPAAAQAAIEALSSDQKKDILNRVLRSPQFHQSLGSLTVALRDGGLPMIGEALQVKVDNGGLIKGGSIPMGGGDAVEAFVKGVKKTVEEEANAKK